MRFYDQTWQPFAVALDLKRLAQYGIYNGNPLESGKVVQRCRGLHVPSGSMVVYTRDAGMHTCGWWKNPDYNQCLHLSLSFIDPITRQRRDRDKRMSDEWVELFFGNNKRLLWVESPFSEDGKKLDVWHYRLFVSPDFSAPILPRKEVYSRDFIPKGWQSWSDQQDAMKTPAFGDEIPGEVRR